MSQQELELAIKQAEELEELSRLQLPYPATFTKASPDGLVNEITLSYEAAKVILEKYVRRDRVGIGSDKHANPEVIEKGE